MSPTTGINPSAQPPSGDGASGEAGDEASLVARGGASGGGGGGKVGWLAVGGTEVGGLDVGPSPIGVLVAAACGSTRKANSPSSVSPSAADSVRHVTR